MKRVYIAGPMTNGTGNSFSMTKIHDAIEAYFQLIEAGFAPHCPHLTVFAEFMTPHRISYEQWLELDEAYIEDCDIVLRIPGPSKGADQECGYARSLGKPIYYSLDSLLRGEAK